MKLIITILLLYTGSLFSQAPDIMRGQVIDSKTNRPIAYVNVGIVNKDVGTVTNNSGDFKIVLNEAITDTDSLKFSMIGYEPIVYSITDFRNAFVGKRNALIKMNESVVEVGEVIIHGKQFKTKVLGNETESKFLGGGFGSEHLGTEIGIRANIKRKKTFIQDVNFFISYNRFDSVAFRVNIYKLKGRKPAENLLKENIIVRLGNEVGKISVDLSKYNIVVDDDVLVSLEWVEKKGNFQDSILVFSAALFSSRTYMRKTSHSKWETKRLGLGINVTAKYE